MPDIMTREAGEIAKKLSRQQPQKPNRDAFTVEQIEGGKHTIVKLYYGKKFVGQFGIQRGSKPQRHNNYVSEQIHLSRTQAYDLAKCPFSVDDYIDELISRGEIEAPAQSDKPAVSTKPHEPRQ